MDFWEELEKAPVGAIVYSLEADKEVEIVNKQFEPIQTPCRLVFITSENSYLCRSKQYKLIKPGTPLDIKNIPKTCNHIICEIVKVEDRKWLDYLNNSVTETKKKNKTQ